MAVLAAFDKVLAVVVQRYLSRLGRPGHGVRFELADSLRQTLQADWHGQIVHRVEVAREHSLLRMGGGRHDMEE